MGDRKCIDAVYYSRKAETGQLYNISDDPGAANKLAETRPEQVKAFKKRLAYRETQVHPAEAHDQIPNLPPSYPEKENTAC